MNIHNVNCCGSKCLEENGEVRILPLGGRSNLILCHACYVNEMEWRKLVNKATPETSQWPFPAWEDLKRYTV